MEADEFVRKILEYNPNAKVDMIKKAFNFSKKSHRNQYRQSGVPYFEHPLEVSFILMNLKVGSDTISAALLHDVVEETRFTISDIKKEFGEEIASIVEGLTNIDKINFLNREDYKAENIRKILLATTKDIRIMLIKLADRLHNMRTLDICDEEKRKRISEETLEIYAPIAHKLGMWWVKGELEDLSLRYLEPEVYSYLKKKIAEKRAEREKTTDKIIKKIREELAARNINAKVYGRAKYFYSIYRKMIKKNLDIDEIYDLIAVRIITKTISECYTALGTVHELWTPIPRRFKDYIAHPKANGYQSLHTVLHGPKDKLLEVQIRTEEEHFFAEDGIAAHWRYHGTERDKRFDKKISWLKQLLEWRHDSKNSKDFIESMKLDLFENEIVVFTPKGDPITLKEGATPVDFAYEVHTGVGERCSKALVNGKMVPLNYKLRPGEMVEIITAKDAKPSRQWLNFVVSSKAKSKIKSMLNISVEQDTKRDAGIEYGLKQISELISVKGKKLPIKISRCCNPVPGDPIKGFYTKDRKITVHAADCQNIAAMEKNREASVRWKKIIKKKVTLRATLRDKEGILSKVLNLFVKFNLIITSVNTRQGRENNFNLYIELEEPDEEKLDDLISRLRSWEEVINVSI